MAYVFSMDEVFEIAEQIERNGAKFYRKAARSFDEDGKKMLLDLAEMEENHERLFSEMRRDFAEESKLPESFDPNGEAALYLQAIADGYVFKFDEDPSEKLKGTERMEDVLKIAIGLENDSIAFYTGIREAVPDRLGKDKVSSVVIEEMGHVRILKEKLVSLK
ncbi:MAG: ferritin family protein [Deltaproteobacteria bacterium]|uniref:Ferritin family protein n=1 Tax=Candidatus Zymogenus saltonus TaxID=2844893 RepID=A0A9D8KFT4_9DELT|nr:ferritin family protein [Candidatus Zymogenus saltonus]